MLQPKLHGLIDRHIGILEEEPKGDGPMSSSFMASITSIVPLAHIFRQALHFIFNTCLALSISGLYFFLQRGLFVCGGLGQFVHFIFQIFHPSAQLFQIRLFIHQIGVRLYLGKIVGPSFTMRSSCPWPFS